MLFRYTAHFCSKSVAKFSINIGGVRPAPEMYTFSVAGRNFPGAHAKDYSEGPPRDVCRADRKASVTEYRGQQRLTQKPKRAGDRLHAGSEGWQPPAKAPCKGQRAAGSHSPLP